MRTPLLLYGLALVVRVLLIWHFPDPAYPDSAYYVDVARALRDGHGFNVDFIWIFAEVGGKIPADPVLPIASNAHWMPLASLVQLPFVLIFGNAAWASAAPFALIGSLAAPLTWAIARDAGARTFVSVGAGILVAVPVLTLAFMAQPDNFSLYQPLVAGSLWMAARGLRGSSRSFIVAGLLAGLATLARNDGLLVLAALGIVFAWDRRRGLRSGGAQRPMIPISAAIGCVLVYAAVMAPWWIHQLLEFGSLSPSTASGKVLFIRDIAEWNSIATPADLGHLLGMGIGPLIATRIGGLIAAVTIYLVLVCGVLLGPTLVIGAWARRHSGDFAPFFVYAALLFGFSALVSAVHVPGGTFIHSAVALAPHSYILALEGIAVGVRWVAARRTTWNAPLATRVFGAAAIVFAILIGFEGALGVHATWGARRDRATAVADALDRADVAPTERIMSIDAAGTKYATGRGGVVLVNDPLDTIVDVALAYRIRWLVIDTADSVDAVAPILSDDVRPAWIGPAIYTERNLTPDASGAVHGFSLGVYPICLDGTPDPRCFPARATPGL